MPTVCAAPHLPAGILSPRTGRGDTAATSPLPLLPVHGEKVPEGRMRGSANGRSFALRLDIGAEIRILTAFFDRGARRQP